MKKSIWISTSTLVLTLMIIGFACTKTTTEPSAVGSNKNKSDSILGILTNLFTPTAPPLQVPNSKMSPNCPNAPDYGDSILYDKWKGLLQSHKVKPINNVGIPGKYIASPEGLVINSSTGEINVSASEKGVRYLVGFIKQGTTDTCFSTLITAGITYKDHIYVVAQNDTLAIPYYNANPLAPAICDNSGDEDYPDNGGGGNTRCEFDDDIDLDGLGLGDEPPLVNTLNQLLVRVRTLSGVVNLKKTLLDGAFGLLPLNGMRINVVMYYRLNDASGRMLQKIPLQFIYYNSQNDVPYAMRQQVTQNEQNFDNSMVVSAKPRPPMIVLTRY